MKMKKILSVILAAVMLLGCMSITAFADGPATLTGFAGGDGSAENPYQIATVEQLANLATIVNGGNSCADTYFVLTADIGSEEEPVTTVIGDSYWSPFGGYLDGQNHTVTMGINRDNSEDYIGLIGYSYDGTISNVNIAGSVNARGIVGGVCGRKEGGAIINCHNSATLTYSNAMMGGYVMGGVCGTTLGGNIINCSNSGAVTLNGMMVMNCALGGICGTANRGASIANCYNSGAVSGNSERNIEMYCYCGGICGKNDDGASVVNCYNSGAVSGTEANDYTGIGGVCGYNWSSVSDCYYNNEICTIGGVNGSDKSDPATGLTAEQIKGAATEETSLAYKLNNYTDESGSYPEGWEKWAIGSDGYPTFTSLAPEEPEGPTTLSTFTLSKDYTDTYTSEASTKVSEEIKFTIAPIGDAPEFDDDEVTMTVTSGVGSVDVTLPTTFTAAGDYWYTITESEGSIAGVTYNTTPCYLHLVVYKIDGAYKVVSAAIHEAAPVNGVYSEEDKITSVTNSYAEGTLVIKQEATIDGTDSDDVFTEEVTFTIPEGTTIIGNITYTDSEGEHTITPDDWEDDGTVTVDVKIKGGETVTFEGIPDGTTYEVTQTDSNPELGFGDPDYTVTNGETDEDVVVTDSDKETKVTGTISDSEDDITIKNESTTPIDVGVILENGAFIILALGAIALGVWLVIAKRKNRESVDAE